MAIQTREPTIYKELRKIGSDTIANFFNDLLNGKESSVVRCKNNGDGWKKDCYSPNDAYSIKIDRDTEFFDRIKYDLRTFKKTKVDSDHHWYQPYQMCSIPILLDRDYNPEEDILEHLYPLGIVITEVNVNVNDSLGLTIENIDKLDKFCNTSYMGHQKSESIADILIDDRI